MIQSDKVVIRDPEIRGGKPVLAGTRVGVHTIVGYYRVYGGDIDRIAIEFPHLSRDQIEAALTWYDAAEERRAEIDELLREQYASYESGLAEQRANGARGSR